MSNIPSTAITAALVPVARAAQESARAKKIQTLKNSHHSEDVAELDETGVETVHDQQQEGSGGHEGKQQPKREGERVEIESLNGAVVTPVVAAGDGVAHLDISA